MCFYDWRHENLSLDINICNDFIKLNYSAYKINSANSATDSVEFVQHTTLQIYK